MVKNVIPLKIRSESECEMLSWLKKKLYKNRQGVGLGFGLNVQMNPSDCRVPTRIAVQTQLCAKKAPNKADCHFCGSG